MKSNSEKKYYIKKPNQSVVCTQDDILMTRTGNTGMVVTNVEGVFHNNFFKVAYPNYINKKYLYNFLKLESTQNLIKKMAGTSTIPDLNHSDFYRIHMAFPSLSEQTKIATFLSLIDSRIQTQNKIIEGLKSQIQGFREHLFSQKIRFKDIDGNDFPNWEVKKLGEVLIKNSNKNKGQKYSLVQSVSNKYGFINQDEMFEDRRVASKDTSNYYVIEKGYFAYNPSRINVGSLAYKYDNEISVISPLYISFFTNKNFLQDNYLLNWFSTKEFIMQMNSSFEGSVRNTLSYEALVKIRITIPSNEEQICISNFLSSIDEKIEIEKQLLTQYENQKKHLLQNMFV